MSTLIKAKGNMYDWVTHTHSHIGGRCPHQCSYCYVQAMAKRFPVMKKRYDCDLHIIHGSLDVDYGRGNTIFVDHLNDLFAWDVQAAWISEVLEHCEKYPDNQYVYQTKNPARYSNWLGAIPSGSLLGTTIETNDHNLTSKHAPLPEERASGICDMAMCPELFQTFITIEPIMDFDLDEFAEMIINAAPDFVNIGADSKGHGLVEPSWDKVMALAERLTEAGVTIRKKVNLDRLKGVRG